MASSSVFLGLHRANQNQHLNKVGSPSLRVKHVCIHIPVQESCYSNQCRGYNRRRNAKAEASNFPKTTPAMTIQAPNHFLRPHLSQWSHRLLALFLELFGAHWTVPSPVRLTLQSNAGPVKPFVGTVVVVTSNHVTIAHVMAQAILFVVATLLIIIVRVAQYFVSISVLTIDNRRPPRSAISAILVISTSTINIRQLAINSRRRRIPTRRLLNTGQ